MPELRPFHADGHAITDTAFVVKMSSDTIPQTIRDLIGLHSKLSTDYPRKRDVTGQEVTFLTHEERTQLVHGRTGQTGFIFDSLRSNGEVERSIKLENTALSVTRSDYQKWEETWPEVRSIFRLMLPLLMERADVAAFHLQYSNKFIWTGDRDSFQAVKLFRKDTQFLAPNVFKVHDLWHSYHGYFEDFNDPQIHQRLHVIEVKVLTPPESDLVVQIQLNHRIVPESNLNEKDQVLSDERGFLDVYMNAMHAANGNLLARLITDEMCEKIDLERPE